MVIVLGLYRSQPVSFTNFFNEFEMLRIGVKRTFVHGGSFARGFSGHRSLGTSKARAHQHINTAFPRTYAWYKFA
jgi:hypothetical protein